MRLIESQTELEQLVSENRMTLLYFGSDSCGVCQALKPKIEDLLLGYPKIASGRIDTAKSLELAAKHSVFTIPVVLIFAEGKVFSVTIIVRVLLRVFDRITGLNPVQVESSSSSIRGGKGEALPGGQRAATLHQDKASIPNTTHYDRSMVRRFCQRVQS